MLRSRPPVARRASQRGVVLLVALVVLVAITVAAVAMIRSVDTATLVAGNLAFQQSATQAADRGIEAAVKLVQDRGKADLLTEDTAGYIAFHDPALHDPAGETWQEFWADHLQASAGDGGKEFGNQIYFIVHRLCKNKLPAGAGGECVTSPAISTSRGGDMESGAVQITGSTQIYYRVTVRVVGPRRTESYVQSHISM